MKKENLAKIKSEAPNAWADFNRYAKETYEVFFNTYPTLNLENFPFAMLLGLFQEYLIDSAGAELDLGNLSYEQLENDVVEAFIIHEVVMRHYS